jgi:NADH-quinone oxidoreductase subunit L
MSTLLDLAWLIPVFPFLSFVAVALVTAKNRKLSHSLVIGGIAVALLLAQIVFWTAVAKPVGAMEHAYQSDFSIPWLPAGRELLNLNIWVDPATTVMLFMVPLVCLMIFIYSVGYMNFGTDEVDPRYSRFFAYIALFATGMLGMIVFNNLLAFFIFWEIMGTCSYLLIGFWYEKTYPDPNKITPKEAGLKAFIVTKIGDLFFMLGLVLLYAQTGSLAYEDIFAAETLHHLAETQFMGTSMATVIALLLFGGTVGKSAQFPLHVWLPDAMEGPTPVSALIHAATMVSAGVFLVVRSYPIFQAAEVGVLAVGGIPFVAFIGALTAFGSSLMAIAQDDVKGVLAFSTISQLGYMVAALGIGAYVAGVFHLITHAFFKALLFLSSGSVIHGVEHGHHHVHAHAHDEHEPHGEAESHIRHEEREGHAHAAHEGSGGETHGEEKWFNPNDMMNMGGLYKRMPRTFWAFLIGGLALSGFPLITAGFWSKDEILAQAFTLSQPVFWTLTVSAGITAFYTARQLCLTFAGEPRTEAAAHAPESVPSMTTPLLILAFFAITLGWVGIPEHFPVIGGLVPNWVHDFVGSMLGEGHGGEHAGRVLGHLAEAVESHSQLPLVMGLTFALGGLGLGWLVYGRKPLQAGEPDRIEAALGAIKLGWVYRALENRLYFDELYGWTIVKGSILLARFSAWFDSTIVDSIVNFAGWVGRTVSVVAYWLDANVVDAMVDLAGEAGRFLSEVGNLVDFKVVDGAVDAVGDLVRYLGRVFRPIQTGKVQNYLLLASGMMLALVAIFFITIQILQIW